jgi:hypothetical protein
LTSRPQPRQICATYSAFAALSTAGSVIAWGDPDWGGDASSVANDLRQGVVQVPCGLRVSTVKKWEHGIRMNLRHDLHRTLVILDRLSVLHRFVA